MRRFLTVSIVCCLASGLVALDLPRSVAKPSVTAEAVLSWSVDLETMATGFDNLSAFSLVFPLLDQRSFAKTGKGASAYGEIRVRDLALSLDPKAGPEGDEVLMNKGAVSYAAFHLDKLTLSIYGAPALEQFGAPSYGAAGAPTLYMTASTTVGGHEAPAIDTTLYTRGTTLGYKAERFSVGLTFLSAGTSANNLDNLYAFGGSSFLDLGPLLDLNLAAAFVPATLDYQLGANFPMTLALVARGLVLTPALDFSSSGGTTAFDAGFTAVLNLSTLNMELKATNITAKVSYCANGRPEFALSFTEPIDGGFSDDFACGASFRMRDPSFWGGDADIGYRFELAETTDLTTSLNFVLTSDGLRGLYARMALADTRFANTTFSLLYASGNLLASTPDYGYVQAVAKIAIE